MRIITDSHAIVRIKNISISTVLLVPLIFNLMTLGSLFTTSVRNVIIN